MDTKKDFSGFMSKKTVLISIVLRGDRAKNLSDKVKNSCKIIVQMQNYISSIFFL